MCRKSIWLVVIFLIISGCAYSHKTIREKVHTVYVVEGSRDSMVGRFAPAFLTYNHREAYNRIGRPSARFDKRKNEQIYVDHRKPVIYFMTRDFSTHKGCYTNLIYRIQFPRVPFSLIPYHLSAGKNVGLLVIVTMDEDQRPLLITTVGTCGCYVASVPTTYLSLDAFPKDWKNELLFVYGERLPAILNYKNLKKPRLLVHLRSAVHRVMDLEVAEEEMLLASALYTTISAPLTPAEALEKIPIKGKTTSFYHNKWPLKGHVKGAIKPWETLLLSIVSLDFFVGMDKVYGDSSVTGNPFYTSLKPWNRKASDLWEFQRFLKFRGWRL